MTATLKSPVLPSIDPARTVADLIARLGHLPPARILMSPAPGTATAQDVIDIRHREGRLCELIDGVLVEKTMGIRESFLAIYIATILNTFVLSRNAGIVTGADGTYQFLPDVIRIPDVAYVSWNRLGGGPVPDEAIPAIVPDLVVEVLSPSNTVAEMKRKRQEYFKAGVRLLWSVDPDTRTVAIYTSPRKPKVLDEKGILEAGDLLPGFTLPVRDIFSELDRCARVLS